MTPTLSAGCCGSAAAPAPDRHVNYVLGMVLGEDDFEQEFAYHDFRNRWAARTLAGYGTVCGLTVGTRAAADGPEVTVAPGSAVGPHGHRICVSAVQCAKLNGWLARNKDAVLAKATGTPPTVAVYAALGYAECLTDPVPVPGEPCRIEDDLLQPSRVRDHFRLELTLDPPAQVEEDEVRRFVRALSAAVEITDAAGPFATEAEVLTLVRQLTTAPAAPPAGLRVRATDAPEFLRAAYRVWAEEARPEWLKAAGAGCCEMPAETRLLLAELRIPLTVPADGPPTVTDLTAVTIDERRRPYLLPLRLLQEWLLYRPTGGGGGGPGLPGKDGVDGKDGKDGKDGVDGQNGADGTNGTNGIDGQNGRDGTDGQNGQNGTNGQDGRDGRDGNTFIVAAGRFGVTGARVFGFNQLEVRRRIQRVYYLLIYSGYDSEAAHVVKGTAFTQAANEGQLRVIHTVEAVPFDQYGSFNLNRNGQDGLLVRVMGSDRQEVPAGFMVEISRFADVDGPTGDPPQ